MSSTLSPADAAAASARIWLCRRSEAACTLNRHSETDLRRPAALPSRDRRRSAAPAAANAALTTAPETRRDVRRVTAAVPGPCPVECSVIVVVWPVRHVIATRRETWPEVDDRKQLWRQDRRRSPARSPCWRYRRPSLGEHTLQLVGFPYCRRGRRVCTSSHKLQSYVMLSNNAINERHHHRLFVF